MSSQIPSSRHLSEADAVGNKVKLPLRPFLLLILPLCSIKEQEPASAHMGGQGHQGDSALCAGRNLNTALGGTGSYLL